MLLFIINVTFEPDDFFIENICLCLYNEIKVVPSHKWLGATDIKVSVSGEWLCFRDRRARTRNL